MSSQTRFSRYTFQKTLPPVLKDFTLASALAPIGRGHFGVALHTSTNQISVVRKQPDQTIFSYDPFTASN